LKIFAFLAELEALQSSKFAPRTNLALKFCRFVKFGFIVCDFCLNLMKNICYTAV